MLKLKLQYFGHLRRRVDSLEKTWCWEGLGSGEGDDRGWDGWMASLTRWTRVCMNSGSWWWTGRPRVLWFMGSQRVGHDWANKLSWTVMNWATRENCFFVTAPSHMWRLKWMEINILFNSHVYFSLNWKFYYLSLSWCITSIHICTFAYVIYSTS